MEPMKVPGNLGSLSAIAE